MTDDDQFDDRDADERDPGNPEVPEVDGHTVEDTAGVRNDTSDDDRQDEGTSIAEVGEVIRLLQQRNHLAIQHAVELKRASSIEEEMIQLPEVQDTALAALEYLLEEMEVIHEPEPAEKIVEFYQEFSLLEQPETRDRLIALCERKYLEIIEAGDAGCICYTDVLIPHGHEVDESKIHKAVERAYIDAYKADDLDRVIPLTRLFRYSPDFDINEVLKSEALLEESRKQARAYLARGSLQLLNYLVENSGLELDTDFLSSAETQQAVRGGVETALNMGRAKHAIEIVRDYSCGPHAINDIEIRQLGMAAIVNQLEKGKAETAAELKSVLGITNEALGDIGIESTLQAALKTALQESHADNVFAILDNFQVSGAVRCSEAVKDAAVEGLFNTAVRTANLHLMTKLSRELQFSGDACKDTRLESAVSTGLIAAISSGQLYRAETYCNLTAASDEIIQSAPVRAALDRQIAAQLARLSGSPRSWLDAFGLPESRLNELLTSSFTSALREGNFERAQELIEESSSLEAEVALSSATTSETVQLISDMELRSYQEVLDFAQAHSDYFWYATEVGAGARLKKSDLEVAAKVGISFIDADYALRDGVDLKEIKGEEQYEALYRTLSQRAPNWRDPNVQKRFEEGAAAFGFKRMFHYVHVSDMSPHYALQGFGTVCALQRASELSAPQFFGQILAQVLQDSTQYNRGSAVSELSHIARALAGHLENAQDLAFVGPVGNANIGDRLQTLLPTVREFYENHELECPYNEVRDIFQSWERLKKFEEAVHAARHPELSRQLAELKQEGKTDLYRYVRTMAYHQDSRVSVDSVFQFWHDPEGFLAAGASYTPAEVHDCKKPSNYFHMPYLDLSATELRDALVSGVLDKLQVFSPFEVQYTVYSRKDQVFSSLREMADVALGSYREKRKGLARDDKALFKRMKGLLGGQQQLRDYLGGKAASSDLEVKIREAVLDDSIGLEVDRTNFTAKINRKSDPLAALAGDDTACCMPFGDGKSTLYTFNLGTSFFTLQVEKPGGGLRTCAQSVLTKDADVGRNVSDIVSDVNAGDTDIEQILPAEILAVAPRTLSADNVEVGPNYQTPKNRQMIEHVYRDFFRKYLERFGEEQGLREDLVPIGMSNSDALRELDTIINTFLPLAPVSYSDKTSSHAYGLSFNKETSALAAEVVSQEGNHRREESTIRIRGVSHLTYEDTLATAYLESMVYSDNPELLAELHNIENALIAKEINNAAKDRPNMSFKHEQNGKLCGYLLAYEGRLGANDPLELDRPDEEVLYIADLAAASDSRFAGGKLLKAFVQQYRQGYLEQGKCTPIFGQFRDTSSYKILQKHLERFGEELGVTFELDEVKEYSKGHDTMHAVIIRPRIVDGLELKEAA